MNCHLRGLSATCVLAIALPLAAQTPLGTDFTYQGQLRGSGVPIVGNADFQFSLHDSEIGGSQVGTTLSKTNVGIVNGLFTLSLDFGPSAFNGHARWIEASVRSPAGSGGFTTLTPRQPLAAAPYALQTRGITVDATGRVGIGTSTPGSVISSKLDVVGGDVVVSSGSGFLCLDASGTQVSSGMSSSSSADLRLITGGEARMRIGVTGRVVIGPSSQLSGAEAGLHIRNEPTPIGGTLALEGNTHTFLSLYPDGPVAGRKGYFGFTSAGGSDITLANETGTGRIVLDAPNGIVMTDSGGSHFPAGGMEELRLVRGNIDGNGTTDAGTGFTCERLSEGDYEIIFNPPYTGTPSVTVTCVQADGDNRYANTFDLTANHVFVLIEFPGGSGTDSDFSFCAIGPR